ncbi:MAG: primosomal protein N' [Oscillospiraceae bacterium]|nr:primosomal protein N' [Oscillospiraceae bacterium]
MIAKIAADKTAFHFDRLFDYSVPDELEHIIAVGCRVVVPFGRGNAKRQGMVLELCGTSRHENIKPIISLIDQTPILNDEMLKIAAFLADTTFCTIYEAVRAVLPRGLNYNVDKGVLKRLTGDAVDRMITVKSGADEEFLTEKQQKVVNFLRENGDASVKETCYLCAVTSSVIKTLVIKNVLKQYERKVFRTPCFETDETVPAGTTDNGKLTDPQQKAVDGLLKQIRSRDPECALLHGITGSGKTRVFLELIQQTVQDGKTAIMLVPEISLTPQTAIQFKRKFGENVAVLHSALSMGERIDEWARINTGKASIVVGTRSAIFAPLKNIGIIVMDEEGESSYKSEASPRYHARDIAKFRCAYHNAALLLASATPALQSYYHAVSGRYTLYELNERYSNAVLPEVAIVDLRLDDLIGNTTLVSDVLKVEINKNLERKEQTLLLLNRRGFNAFAMCQDCLNPVKCPNCSVSFTYHKINDCLMCHHCGYFRDFTPECKECASVKVRLWGMGTQRIQEELTGLFPRAEILRMDIDSVNSRYDFEQKFKQFSDGEYDIMVGTQMIAKGLDFPNLTLVGILAIDQLLYSGDYKSPERVFALLTQVVGRSGRAKKPGRAFIQTYTPEHPIIIRAATQDYKSFYEEEISIRKATLNPPYCDICVIGVSGTDEKGTHDAINTVLQTIKDIIKDGRLKLPLRVLGPAKPPVYRMNNKYRMRIMLKCKNNPVLRSLVRQTLVTAGERKEFKDINLYADFE